MWLVASEAYAYLAGRPFLTDSVLHNRKTDNDRQITNKPQAAAEINQHTNQLNEQKSSWFGFCCICEKCLAPLASFRNWWQFGVAVTRWS